MPAPPDSPERERRGFLAALTGALGALMGAVVLLPGLGFLADPLRRVTVRGPDRPVRVGSRHQLKPGKPLRVTIVGQRVDAWTRLDNVKLGAAWLVQARDGAPVRAFSSACPHAGCGVDFDGQAGSFSCPCHGSTFDLDGRCLGGPAPRGLDELAVSADEDDILVRYQRFKVGLSRKEPVG